MTPAVIAFDVNETLLDMRPLRAGFRDLLGTEAPLGEWFARMLHASLVANHLGQYRDFEDLGAEALLGLARRRGTPLSEAEARRLVARLRDLPAHPDVLPALERLSGAGHRMITLTNGGIATANAQVDNAGLRPFIEAVVSVEEIGKFKPAREVYEHAAGVAGVAVHQMLMVAAHDWDVAGAMVAGVDAVFLERAGAVWAMRSIKPPMVVPDLVALAERLAGNTRGGQDVAR